MAPKLLARCQLSTSSISSSSSNVGIDEDVQPTTLEPKACFTCGRGITPRAKWARNWSSIRYCSDRCKSWKSLFLVGKAFEYKQTEEKPVSLLESCLVIKDSNLFLYLDAWIEATMMHLVDEKVGKQSQIKGDRGVALQKVSESMHLDLQLQAEQTSLPHYIIAIRDNILQQAPGEREMIRRAARRFVVLSSDRWAYTKHFGPSLHQIAVFQKNGKQNLLQTLQDVSFAKGEMYIDRKT